MFEIPPRQIEEILYEYPFARKNEHTNCWGYPPEFYKDKYPDAKPTMKTKPAPEKVAGPDPLEFLK